MNKDSRTKQWVFEYAVSGLCAECVELGVMCTGLHIADEAGEFAWQAVRKHLPVTCPMSTAKSKKVKEWRK